MKLNLTMLLRIMEMIGVDVNDNVDDFNEDTCKVCLYDVESIVQFYCEQC